MPPAATANGKINSGDFAFPYQPTRLAVTMKVPAANPYRPRIDGAAIGCRKTRAWSRHSRSSPLAPLVVPCVVVGGVVALMTNLLTKVLDPEWITHRLPGPARVIRQSVCRVTPARAECRCSDTQACD